jgi:hypothetical protein
MIHNHIEGYDSPIALELYEQQMPMLNREITNETNTNKRPRSNISSPNQQQADLHRIKVNLINIL